MSDPSAPRAGWYTDPEQPSAERFWDGTVWTARVRQGRALRDVGALFAAVGGVLARRGGTIVAVSAVVWGAASVLALAAVWAVLDMGAVSLLLSNLPSALQDASEGVTSAASDQAWETWQSGAVWRFGWQVAAVAAVGLIVLYVLTVSFVTTAVSYIAGAWLSDGRAVRGGAALSHATRRVLPGASVFIGWVSAAIAIVVGPAVVGALVGSGASFGWGVGGALLGFTVGTVGLVALYLRWSLTSQAVALSATPWKAFAVSSRATSRHRWGIAGRLVLMSMLTAFAVSLVFTPVSLVEPVLGSVSPLVVTVAVMFVVRVAMSAVNTAVVAAVGSSIYVDTAGEDYQPAGDNA